MVSAVNPHPTKLGKYDIVRVVGAGAMGVVYEGFDPVIERTVAIKTIRKDALDPEDAEEHSRRFLIEARAAGKLNHPNIVAVYDFGDEQGQSYLVMEYVEGKELKSYFDAKHAFSAAETLRLVSELLDALGYSHRQGVIHRDVKPANLFVTQSGSLKLGDFGIARIDSTQKTHDGTLLGTALGTPSYMPPEQVRGETADARSDLYSVGVILYQFLVGEKPFSGSMVAVMQKVLNEPPPKPSAIDARLSPAVDAIVARALAKQREDRYQSAEAFGEALEEALGEGTLMMPARISRPLRPQPAARATTPSDVTASSASHRSGAWASATWVGTQPGDGVSATQRSGLSELRQRAEEAQRKAQEKIRRAEQDAEIAEQARHERGQAAQSRFKVLGEAATAQLGRATEIAEAAQLAARQWHLARRGRSHAAAVAGGDRCGRRAGFGDPRIRPRRGLAGNRQVRGRSALHLDSGGNRALAGDPAAGRFAIRRPSAAHRAVARPARCARRRSAARRRRGAGAAGRADGGCGRDRHRGGRARSRRPPRPRAAVQGGAG